MSRHDIGCRESFRLRHGLRWQGDKPGWRELKRWGTAAAVVIAWATIMLLVNAIDNLATELHFAKEAAAIFERSAQVLKDCERGAAGYYYADGRAFACGGNL